MKRNTNITARFFENASRNPDKIALLGEDMKLTFGELVGMVTVYALHMQGHGVRQGSMVQVKSEDPAVTIATVLASALLGCAWSSSQSSPQDVLDLNPTHRFSAISAVAVHSDVIRIDESWRKLPKGFDMQRRPRFQGFADDETTWIIFPSSGTTGTPKLIALSHWNMIARTEAVAYEFEGQATASVFLFAQSSAPSLIRSLSALLSGGTLVFSLDPQFWREVGVTHVFASPRQIAHILSEETSPEKLSKALIGGDGIPDSLAERLLGAFDVVVNTYGSTEANMVVENQKIKMPDGSISTKTLWHDSIIEIVDENDVPLKNGSEGIVRIRNSYLAGGYLNNAPAAAAAFREEWFYPGDRGVISEQGDFTVTGRSAEIFNLGGAKVNAAYLDFTIQTIPGVDDAISFLMPEPDGSKSLVCLIKAKPYAIAPDLTSEARIRIALSISTEAVPDRFLFVDTIPRTANGKPDRSSCVEMAKRAREHRRS